MVKAETVVPALPISGSNQPIIQVTTWGQSQGLTRGRGGRGYQQLTRWDPNLTLTSTGLPSLGLTTKIRLYLVWAVSATRCPGRRGQTSQRVVFSPIDQSLLVQVAKKCDNAYISWILCIQSSPLWYSFWAFWAYNVGPTCTEALKPVSGSLWYPWCNTWISDFVSGKIMPRTCDTFHHGCHMWNSLYNAWHYIHDIL